MLPNADVILKLPTYDVLILPSQGRGDGWGAVVNEAINAGCAVVCSHKCGAKDLVVYGKVGKVFEAGNVDSLHYAIEDLLEKDRLKEYQRNALNYRRYIYPEAAVDYFEKVVLEKEEAVAPWLQMK